MKQFHIGLHIYRTVFLHNRKLYLERDLLTNRMTRRLTLGGWPTVTRTFSAVRCDGSTRKTYQVRETPRSGVADPRPRLLISPTPRAQASPGFACDPKSRARESRMRTASRTLPCTASRTAPRILPRNRLGAALNYRSNGERT